MMVAPERAAGLTDVLHCVLRFVDKTELDWHPDAFVARDPLSAAERANLDDLDDALEPEELSEDLQAELRGAVRRGAAAKLEAALACVDRFCRDKVGGDSDATTAAAHAAARAARAAQAQAVLDISRALSKFNKREHNLDDVAPALEAWCRADAVTALDGRYVREPSPARKWRAFAREVTGAVTMPARIRAARRMVTRNLAGQLGALLGGHALGEDVDPELQELAGESCSLWRVQLVELLQ